ncbi:hypothetical protein MLD38_034057 [Melastoma candidum]|uniref:Uncharacterized protein n=1 Tax=Melastoma candidum TaxID=119954 RepID=A0ACB9MA40_9MYRT|nr:hypothetical protein MLD38_034057 [Melastoma candidum]
MVPVKPSGLIPWSPKPSIFFYDRLLNACAASKSPLFANAIHAHLLKSGFFRHTFLGNRCLDLYADFGHCDDVVKAFGEIEGKNLVSWNVFLKGLVQFGPLDDVQRVFDVMPVRDTVTWNSMLSGCVLHGVYSDGMDMFRRMMNDGVRLSHYTYSILSSLVSCARHGKEVHGAMIRNLWHDQNAVLGNSLINMYGKLGFVNYAYTLFLTMGRIDIVSWNSLILGFSSSACGDLCDLGMDWRIQSSSLKKLMIGTWHHPTP